MNRSEKIDALFDALCKMWAGGGGDYGGVFTVAVERDKVKALLHELLDEPKKPGFPNVFP
jgi:hypothetical protein